MLKVVRRTREVDVILNQQTAEDILRYHRAQEVDSRLMPIKDIITLIDEI